MAKVKYFSRFESTNNFSVIMRDDEGFESAVDSAKSREQANVKAARWQAKEDRLAAKSIGSR